VSELINYVKENFYDSKFKHNKLKYVAQCMLATLSILATLMALNVIENTVVIAAIGSTSFIVFAMPFKQQAAPKFILGGYFIGISVGTICYFLTQVLVIQELYFIQGYFDEFFGALAVGLSIFLMVITDTEHPPAAGLALGLVINEWSIRTVTVTCFAISILIFMRYLFRDKLINLL